LKVKIQKKKNSLYGCKSWSLTLREERNGFRVFEKRVLWIIFGCKRKEVAEDWKRLQNEELHKLDVSSDVVRLIKSRRMRWSWHVACTRNVRNSFKVLVGEPEGRDTTR
jgi:hypothetical protein